jgi:hypothetical protein
MDLPYARLFNIVYLLDGPELDVETLMTAMS